MDAKAFEKKVYLRKPSGVSQEALTAAITYHVSINRTEERDIADCIQLAGRFDDFTASTKEAGQPSTKRLSPLTPGNLARRNDLTTLITPDVEQLRQEFFGSTQVPFRSYEDAAAWIQKAGKEQDDFSPEERQTRQDLHKEIYDKLREWSRLTGEGVHIYPGQRRYLPYIVRVNGELREYPYPVRRGFPLAKLEEVSQRFAGITGFRQSSVVRYILTGIKPLLTPVQCDFVAYGDERIHGVQTTVIINTPDVMDEQLREIRREIRACWGVAKTKPLTDTDSQLLTFVGPFGDKPHWPTVYKAWCAWCEREQQPTRFGSARSMSTVYRRLRKKLSQTTHGVPWQQWVERWSV